MKKPYLYNKLLSFLKSSGNDYQTHNKNTVTVVNGYLTRFVFVFTDDYTRIINPTINYTIDIPTQSTLVRLFNKMFELQMITMELFDLILKQIVKNSDRNHD